MPKRKMPDKNDFIEEVNKRPRSSMDRASDFGAVSFGPSQKVGQ
jgi:hypothetical protein